MNPYNFALLFFSFCCFSVAVLIALKRQDSVGKSYFIFSLFVSLWGMLVSFVYYQEIAYDAALFFGRAADMFAIFIPVTWLHFVFVLTHKDKNKFIAVLYILSFILACFSFTPFFIPKLKPASGLLYYMHPGPIYHLFTFIFFTIVPFGFFILIKRINSLQSEERFQLTGLTGASALSFLGGGLTFLPIYDFFTNVPQYNLFIMPTYPFIVAYFMIRHRLFDMEAIAQAFQREKLATIGLLAASVNHEIRNPLYIAKTTLENQIENRKGDEASKKSLNAINRALDVVNKLNHFAKPISNPLPRDSKASVKEALKTVIDLISYEFELDKIQINDQIPENLPLIQADQRQLEEILFNLIVNACHAMEAGGTLTVACHPEQSEGSRIKINIQDTGHGISSDHMKHLFEPFRSTKGEKGSGLGLYITKQLVERNDGRISVHSKVAEGTSFTLQFKEYRKLSI